MRLPKTRSNLNYIPVGIVILVTYYYCFDYALGIHYRNYLPEILLGKSRYYAISFMMGVLGANVQMSIHLARECNMMVLQPENHFEPVLFEFFGYIMKAIWGGLAALIFILALQYGFLAILESSADPMKIESMIVICFVVGLNALNILKRLSEILKKSDR